MATNYGAILGIQNKWAPIVFAVIYFLVMLWYLAQVGRRHQLVYVALAFFSALRVISFSLRAAIASNHHNAAFNRRMAIAYEVLYNVGFFSLLLSAHRLLNDRRRMTKISQAREKGRNFLHRSMGGCHKGRLVELLLLLSVILGAVGISYTLGANTGRISLGNRLTDASTYIFLVVTLILALFTILGIHLERSLLRGPTAPPAPIGSTAHLLILFLIAVLLLLRVLFFAATVHQRAIGQPTPASAATSSIRRTAQGNEHFWYPLAALAELLVVLMFLAPRLVPLRSMLTRHHDGAYPNEKGPTGAGYAAGDNAATGGLGAADNTHNGLSAV